jgi:hypothetical protein
LLDAFSAFGYASFDREGDHVARAGPTDVAASTLNEWEPDPDPLTGAAALSQG